MPLFSAEKVTDLTRFWREMAPVPGRMEGSLRFALTTALAALSLLVLQPPVYTIAPSLFMLFLISHDTPFHCFKDLLTCVSAATAGTAAALLLIMATGNAPVARVLGLAVFTFLATFLFRASTFPLAAMSFGCLTYMVISLWENQIRAERVLHLSLWPLGTLTTVAVCATAVDYLFNRSDPLEVLRREIGARCAALEQLFQLCALHGGAERIGQQAAVVRRYAVTGTGRLHVLLGRIAQSGNCGGEERKRLASVVGMLDRLVVLSAAFAAHGDVETVASERLERIGRALAAARDGRLDQVRTTLGDSHTPLPRELDRIEQTLRGVGEPTKAAPAGPPQPATPAAGGKNLLKRLLIPDALTNPDHLIYALKLSLCATICYIVYNGLKWPGISTAFFTVYFTGLSTTGASNRKLLFRFIGSTIGGLLLGIGCLAFVFSNIESVTGFLLVVAAVALLGAWVSASSYFGYIGLQIVFSFNLLAFERLRAPDQMTPARDRILGITLGLIVMFFIFHQVRPERTVDVMRRVLARLLRAEAELFRLSDMEPNATIEAKCAAIRKQLEAMAANLQTFADVVKFEFDPDRTADMRLSDEILHAATSAADVLVSVLLTWPQGREKRDARVREVRSMLESGLRDIAAWLEQVPQPQPARPEGAMIEDLHGQVPVSVAKTIDSYLELKMVCDGIMAFAA